MHIRKLINKIWGWVSHASTAYGLLPASAMAFLTVTAGFVQDVPVMWIIVGVMIVLSSAATLLVRFVEWQRLRSPTDKLRFQNLRIGQNGHQPNQMLLGIEAFNSADFTIDVEVKKLISSINGSYPPRKPYEKVKFTVPPQSVWWFCDHYIEVDINEENIIEGNIEFEIGYGVKGKPQIILGRNIQVSIKIDNKIISGVSWKEKNPTAVSI